MGAQNAVIRWQSPVKCPIKMPTTQAVPISEGATTSPGVEPGPGGRHPRTLPSPRCPISGGLSPSLVLLLVVLDMTATVYGSQVGWFEGQLRMSTHFLDVVYLDAVTDSECFEAETAA